MVFIDASVTSDIEADESRSEFKNATLLTDCFNLTMGLRVEPIEDRFLT